MTLSHLQNKELPLLKDATFSKDLCELIDSTKQDEKKQAIIALDKGYLSSFTLLNRLQKNIETLKDKKYQHLKNNAFWHWKQNNPFIEPYKEFLNELKKIPIKETRNLLINHLNLVYSAKSPEKLDVAIKALHESFQACLAQQQKNIALSVKKITSIDKTIYEKTEELCQNYNHTIERLKQNNAKIIPLLKESLLEITNQVTNWKDISFVVAKTHALDYVKQVPNNLAYQFIKPTVVAAVNLLRDGNFSQFFANHLIAMPFAKNK